jgi:hypothetical protein
MENTVKYSELVAAKLRAAEVLKDEVVFSTLYEGNAAAGAVKIPVRDAEAEAFDYDSANGSIARNAATSYKTLIINRDKAVNEIIDGFDAATVPDDLIADRLDSAGYALAYAVDNDGASVLISEGTHDNVASVAGADVYAMIIDTRTKLSKANVPNDGRRYLLVTPDFYAALLKDSNFIAASALGDEIRQTGCVGKIAGFSVFEWNDATAGLLYIAGHPNYAVRARAFAVPVKVVDLDGDANFIGASAVKGRMVYAHTVIKPEAVIAVFAPGSLTLTLSGENKAVTVVESGTFKLCLNPSKRAVYGADMSEYFDFTSGEETYAEPGDIIEIISVDDDNKAIAVGYITVQ